MLPLQALGVTHRKPSSRTESYYYSIRTLYGSEDESEFESDTLSDTEQIIYESRPFKMEISF